MKPIPLLILLLAILGLAAAPPGAGAQAQAGTISAANANLASGPASAGSSVSCVLGGVLNAVTLGVQGSLSGTLVVQVTADGANWVTVPNAAYTKLATGSTGAISGVGIWTVPVSGLEARVTCSSYASGSAAVSLIPFAAGGGGGGGGGGGSVTQGTDPWTDDVSQLGGNALAGAGQLGALAVGGAAGSGSAVSAADYPLLLAGSDYAGGTAHIELPKVDSSGNVYVNAGENGTWSVTANAGANLSTASLALESGGNLAAIASAVSGGKMNVELASSSGGVATWNNGGGYVTGAATVDASAGSLYSLDVVNASTAAGYYLELFNAPAGSVTLGSTPPMLVLPVPTANTAPSGCVRSYAAPLAFSSALSVACVTTPYGSTPAPASTVVVTVGYK